MKAITLTQPWATLVAIGAKRIETRSWATSYRGSLAIHAGKGLGPVDGKRGYLEFCTANETVYAALEKAGLVPFTWNADALMALPFGQVIAVCDVVGCMQIAKDDKAYAVGNGPYNWPLTYEERTFGDYKPGRFAWLLDNVRVLSEPIPARGALSLWEWTPPEGFTLY